MAPRPYHLVLRAVRAAAARTGYRAFDADFSLSCSTPTTKRSAPAPTAAARPADPPLGRRGRPPIAPMSMPRWQGFLPPPRRRVAAPSSSSACSTSSSTRNCWSPTCCTPSRKTRCCRRLPGWRRAGRRRPHPSSSIFPAASPGSAHDGRISASTTKPRHRVLLAALPPRQPPGAQREFSPSSRMAATARRRFGCRKAGPVAQQGWSAPLYWRQRDGAWHQFGPAAWRRSIPARPCATSAGTKRMPSPAGPAPGCRPRPNWEAGHALNRRIHRPCLAMDRQRLPALPGFRAAGRDRRIQRQVHDQPDGVARRQRCHPARATPAPPTAISSTPTNAGSSPALT
jgi:hypothetical protein